MGYFREMPTFFGDATGLHVFSRCSIPFELSASPRDADSIVIEQEPRGALPALCSGCCAEVRKRCRWREAFDRADAEQNGALRDSVGDPRPSP